MWDLTGRKLFNFEGHEAPVYSVCPHQKENIQVKASSPLVSFVLLPWLDFEAWLCIAVHFLFCTYELINFILLLGF